MGIFTALLGPVVTLVSNWMTHKQKLAEARQQAEIQWASTMADASKTSWKDEWWVILFSIPLILLMFGYPGPMLVLRDIFGTDALRIIYVAMIGASFGINLHDRFKLNEVKRLVIANGNGNGKTLILNDPEAQMEDE